MQGVNNPGFQLLSLSSSESFVPATPEFSTLPCVLPNQLHIFMIYGVALFVTVVSVCVTKWLQVGSKDPLLPLTRRRSDDNSGGRWKSASSNELWKRQVRTVALEATKDFRKIGVMTVVWYIYLIWY
jgi:hypothetical protein